jgi:dipeptidyl aminopeptidase/acylaminoacyl peptidase
VGIGARRGTQIWVKELPDGSPTPLTTDEGNSRRPTWSLDGTTIAYVRFGPGGREIRVVASDGSSVGAYDVLLDSVEAGVREWVYTPDGQGVVFRRGTVGTADIGYLDLTTGERNDTLLATESTEWAVALSPDGNWMAYVSDETGREEVYVCRFPDMSGFRRVSRDGGTEPVWNPDEDGNELFYRRGDGRMISATYAADSVFTVEDRQSLFDARPFRSGGGWHYYDYSPTEDRFVMVRSTNLTSGPFEPDLIMVQNFFTELEERVGGGR